MTHSDAHGASETKKSNAVNFPGSVFFGSFTVGGAAAIPGLLNVPNAVRWQWHPLNTPGNLKNRRRHCSRFPCCNTFRYHKRVGFVKKNSVNAAGELVAAF